MARSKTARRGQARRAARDWPIIYPGKKPRLYLDNNVPGSFVKPLARQGIDAVHADSEGWSGHDDSFHWQKARELSRTLVTCDLHFWDDQKFPLHDSAGVVILATGARQEWTNALGLLQRFVDSLKTFVRGPGGGRILTRSKIRLSTDRVVWRMLTHESKVSEDAWSWSWDLLEST